MFRPIAVIFRFWKFSAKRVIYIYIYIYNLAIIYSCHITIEFKRTTGLAHLRITRYFSGPGSSVGIATELQA